MLMSMTGFASKTFALPTGTQTPASITISIKSLNSRFFEATFKLPYMLSNLETDLNQLCKKQLKRGHIFFSINISNPAAFKNAVEPSNAVVQSYLEAIDKIKKNYPISGEITIAELIQLPNIFTMEEKGIDDTTKTLITTQTEEVLNSLIAARMHEGEVIQKDMEQRCALLKTIIAEIEKISEKAMAERKEEINKIIEELGNDNKEAAELQRMTLYNELSRMDIHEEVVRFTSHLNNVITLLKSPDIEKGKRLDFTLQELTREINTIAAKCSNAAIGSLAINAKVELEKIREQNQNIV